MQARNKILAACLAGCLIACGTAASDEQGDPASKTSQAFQPSQPKPRLGLMTSLPLYWPLGAEFADLASGEAAVPWQREVLEAGHELVLLDTLSPIAGLTEDTPDTDPLEGLERLAVIQPRGLSPADNVALDDWVRGGGHLLIVLDPMLTGHYELPLGDPRRPNDTAIVPPVVARWGLTAEFDPAQDAQPVIAQLPFGPVPLILSGALETREPASHGGNCRVLDNPVMARCDNVGEGRVTYLADAALFEHALGEGADRAHDHGDHSHGDHEPADHAGEAPVQTEVKAENHPLSGLLRYAFED